MSATGTIFCESCGKPNAVNAKFCEHCGVAVPTGPTAERSAQTSPGGTGGRTDPDFEPRPAAERIDALTPGASELASQLADQLKAPAVAAALIAGAFAAAAVFVIGMVLGLIFSDQSFLGLVDSGKGIITAGFAQMLNFLQVGYGGSKVGPAVFLVFPIGACALAAVNQATRTRGLRPGVRLASGAGIGIVFGLLMLIPALSAGSAGGSDPKTLGAVLLGCLWGATGGTLGTYFAVRREPGPPPDLRHLAPARVSDVSRTLFVALRPLAILLAVMTVAGGITWTVESLLESSARDGEATLAATVDAAAFSVEHGLHWTELGGLAQFNAPASEGTRFAPVPVGNVGDIKTSSTGQYRIFGLNKAMPSYTFIPLLILLIGLTLLLALYAGFAVARSRRPGTQLLAAAWGLLVGPIWAFTLVIVNALIGKVFFGRAVGDSVFVDFLFGGAMLGALGGFLSLKAPKQPPRFPPTSRAAG